MFSNKLIKSIAKSSDEKNLRLSDRDWKIVLNANTNFTEPPSQWRGSQVWGKYLLNKLEKDIDLDFCNSLELCCGNGFVYFSIKDIVNRDNSSIHIDISMKQLQDFRNRCRRSNIQVPNIICNDIGQLPFSDNSLKKVYGNSFLHHLPDVQYYLIEVYRVLQPEGQFVAFHEPTLTAPFLESFPRSLLKDVDTGSLTDIWLLPPEVIKQMMISIGFSTVKIYPNGFFASLLLNPLKIIFAKLKLDYQSDLFAQMSILMDNLDRILPYRFRYKYCPSICVVCKK